MLVIDYWFWKPGPIVSIISIIYHWSLIGSETNSIYQRSNARMNNISFDCPRTIRGIILNNTTIGPIWTYETVFCHRFSSNCFQSFQKSHLSQLSDFDEIVYTTESSRSSQKSLFLSPSFPKRWGPTGRSADVQTEDIYSITQKLLKQQKTKQKFV